jgi:hypothetical protein
MRILVLLAIVALPFAAWAQDMRPGQYRTSMTSDVPNFGNKPVVDEDCFTQQDINDGLTKVGIEKDSSCKVEGFKRAPGKVSFRQVCTENGSKSTNDVTGAMSGDAFDFQIISNSPQMGNKSFRTRIIGKRIGNCS